MSLFGCPPALETNHLVQFNAGKLFRDGNTKMVKPDNRKGTIYLSISEDSLLHFFWKDRKTNKIEDDLIIFPEEAEFVKVSEANPKDRVYVLKFKSSSQKHFFWIQEPKDDKDAEFAKKINQAIENPSMMSPGTGGEKSEHEQFLQLLQQTGNINQRSNATAGTSTAGTSASPAAGSSVDPASLEQMRKLLSSIKAPKEATDDIDLTSVLTVDNLKPILENESSRKALFPHLPEGSPHTQKELEDTIRSPQFRQSVQTLTYALRSGSLASILSQLGLPANTQGDASGVRALLNAIAGHHKPGSSFKTEDDQMDTS